MIMETNEMYVENYSRRSGPIVDHYDMLLQETGLAIVPALLQRRTSAGGRREFFFWYHHQGFLNSTDFRPSRGTIASVLMLIFERKHLFF